MAFVLLANMSPLPLFHLLEGPRLLGWPLLCVHWSKLLRCCNTVVVARGRDVHHPIVIPVVQELVLICIH